MGTNKTTLTRTVTVTGYRMTGTAGITYWGGGTGTVDMDQVNFDHLPDRNEMAPEVNDGGFGCQSIDSAIVVLEELHSNDGYGFVDEYEFEGDEIKNAKRGIPGRE